MRYTAVILSFIVLFTAGCTVLPTELKELGSPVIQTFEAAPAVINAGENTSLRWSTTNSQSVSIDNGIGNVAVNGTLPVSPQTTTFYTLTAKNSMGTASARTQIIVQTGQTTQAPQSTVATPKTTPRIILFIADRTSIPSGEYATIKWNVLDSSTVSLNPVGAVGSSGDLRVYPAETTTFTLTATNAVGDSTASQTITVFNATSQETGREYQMSLYLLPEESGSLIKGTSDYMDYRKMSNAGAGDTSSNLASRAFLSFDISSIPANAVVKEAILDLSRYTKAGDPSYAKSLWGNMGALQVYHLQYGKLDDNYLTAYNQLARLTHDGEFTSYPETWAWDVQNSSDGTPVIQNLINTRDTRCQFRIQFFTSTNWDSASDMLYFDNAALTIKYTVR